MNHSNEASNLTKAELDLLYQELPAGHPLFREISQAWSMATAPPTDAWSVAQALSLKHAVDPDSALLQVPKNATVDDFRVDDRSFHDELIADGNLIISSREDTYRFLEELNRFPGQAWKDMFDSSNTRGGSTGFLQD